jgi:uncharacterized protein (TIGR03790 family)
VSGAFATADLASTTIVIYNPDAADSANLARFYAAQRQIPNDHLVGLKCSPEEEISRREYDETTAEPLRKIFAERSWWRTHQDGGGKQIVDSGKISSPR